MKLSSLKAEASRLHFSDLEKLKTKVLELKESGISFLGCVSFIQTNQKLKLNEARDLIFELGIYNEDEKKKLDDANALMQSEFTEE